MNASIHLASQLIDGDTKPENTPEPEASKAKPAAPAAKKAATKAQAKKSAPSKGSKASGSPAKKASSGKKTSAATKKAANSKKAAPKESASKKPTSKKASDSPPAELAISPHDLARIQTQKGLLMLLREKKIKVKKVLRTLSYEEELRRLQIELVKLQRDIQQKGRRVAILFEGRDAAGKGGAIRRFMEHLNPRAARVVALPKPSEVELGQWYFQRYVQALPNAGEICFFDRSWYNRAVVEPVMNFCSEAQYRRFMRQVPEFEHMLYEDGIELIKFWFSISKDEQKERFDARRTNPLKQWKISPVDERAQARWDTYTHYKEEMFARTHNSFSPWIIVRANSKKDARLESIRYVLQTLEYKGKQKPETRLRPDPDVVRRYHRGSKQDD